MEYHANKFEKPIEKKNNVFPTVNQDKTRYELDELDKFDTSHSPPDFSNSIKNIEFKIKRVKPNTLIKSMNLSLEIEVLVISIKTFL